MPWTVRLVRVKKIQSIFVEAVKVALGAPQDNHSFTCRKVVDVSGEVGYYTTLTGVS